MNVRIPVARRMLWHQPLRTSAAAFAVAASTTLLLFLDGVKRGVLVGAASYAGQSAVDVWIARRGTENLIRSSSIVSAALARELHRDSMVAGVGPVIRVFVRLERGPARLTLLGMGYDPEAGAGGPPFVTAGASAPTDGVILDRGAAHRLGAAVGDTVRMNGVPVVVRGLSAGTNLLGTQLVFANLETLAALAGAEGQYSFYAVRLTRAGDTLAFAERWERRHPETRVFTRAVFARNSLDEVYAGFQPIIASLGAQGGIVAAAVVALILYGRVLERRTELALLVALGGTPGYLRRVVFAQALWLAVSGIVAGLLVTAAIGAAVTRWLPAMTFGYAPGAMMGSILIVLLAAAVGAGLPLIQLRAIEPAEVFRA
jgi:ABC-type antimicrobial peptide transport system permease subunit